MAQTTKKNAPKKSNSIHPIAWAVSGIAVVIAVIMIIDRLGDDSSTTMVQQFQDTPPAASGLGVEAPDFALAHIDGGERSISDYKGKVVMLNFWATWCGPCKMEIPDFIELQDEYSADGFAILGVSLDKPGQEELVLTFAKEKGLNYDVVMGNSTVTEAYGGVRSIPTTFLIDREGKIRFQKVGLQPKEVWVEEIKKLL